MASNPIGALRAKTQMINTNIEKSVMGTKNAATTAQNAYTNAMHNMFDQRSFQNTLFKTLTLTVTLHLTSRPPLQFRLIK